MIYDSNNIFIKKNNTMKTKFLSKKMVHSIISECINNVLKEEQIDYYNYFKKRIQKDMQLTYTYHNVFSFDDFFDSFMSDAKWNRELTDNQTYFKSGSIFISIKELKPILRQLYKELVEDDENYIMYVD